MSDSQSRMRRIGILAGQLVVPAWGLLMLGLGLAASEDWHHHGDHDSGYFHTHDHLGNHRHVESPSSEPNGDHDPASDEGEDFFAVPAVSQALPSLSPPILEAPTADWMAVEDDRPIHPRAARFALFRLRAPPTFSSSLRHLRCTF